MNAALRLATFVLVLAVLFGAGLLAGDAFGPQRDVDDRGSAPTHMPERGHGDTPAHEGDEP